ncbi:MAG: hypothetical protein SV253_02895 [Halobacteria archaeon]|nr:hypothetical protein [Halobacteria archaeon]
MVAIPFVVAILVLGPLILYFLVRSEYKDRDTVDRRKAEKVARRDTGRNDDD